MSLHHEAGDVCPLCEAKLETAHPDLVLWFRRVKKRHINVHISWAFRGQEDQNKMYLEGKTNATFGKSPHNYMEDGKKRSKALDLFLLDEDGVARFPPMFYAKLNAENEADKEPLKWGGKFKSFGDANHFELA